MDKVLEHEVTMARQALQRNDFETCFRHLEPMPVPDDLRHLVP